MMKTPGTLHNCSRSLLAFLAILLPAVLILIGLERCGTESPPEPASTGPGAPQPPQETGWSRSATEVEFEGALSDLDGEVISSRRFAVFSGLSFRWRPEDERKWARPIKNVLGKGGAHWYFETSAAIVTHVFRQPDEGLRYFFQPQAETSQSQFHFLWDGEPVFRQPQELSEEGFEVRIPKDKLIPGTHHLTIRRAREKDSEKASKRKEDRFVKIAWRIEGAEDLQVIQRPAQERVLGDLVDRGVSGSGSKEKRTGFLFDGPQRMVARLTDGDGATAISVQALNGTRGRSLFRITSQGVSREATLDTQESAELTVPFDPADPQVVFEVEGGSGRFLWGGPLFERSIDDSRPPVVVISLDTTRRDALSAYSQTALDLEATPHLAAFAATATTFENAWSTAPWTIPSHASMFTGLYPSHHGAGVRYDRIDQTFVTLAELLRARGYSTGGFPGSAMLGFRFGFGQGFTHYRAPDDFETKGETLSSYALAFLDANAERPFFLFVNYYDPHFPHEAPKEYENRFEVDRKLAALDGLPVWEELSTHRADAWNRVQRGIAKPVPAAIDYLWSTYRAEVAYADTQVGRIFDSLHEQNLWDRALVIIVADHGELFGESGLFGHSARLNPELVRVPLLVKLPGQTTAQRSDRLVSVVDLFPTVLEVAGASSPERDGLSLFSSEAHHESVLIEEHNSVIHPILANMKLANSVFGRQGESWREIAWPEGSECEQRDPEGDSWQTVPCRDDWQALLSAIEAQFATTRAQRPGDPGALSDEDIEALKALGYL